MNTQLMWVSGGRSGHAVAEPSKAESLPPGARVSQAEAAFNRHQEIGISTQKLLEILIHRLKARQFSPDKRTLQLLAQLLPVLRAVLRLVSGNLRRLAGSKSARAAKPKAASKAVKTKKAAKPVKPAK